MDEAKLRTEVLIPLLRAMGFRDVTEYHGAAERGKDIVCWQTGSFGNRQNFAVVAKATQMTGKASIARGSAGEVAHQIKQCFNSDYTDPVTAEKQSVDEVWVVCNKKITQQTIDAINGSFAQSDRRGVTFSDGDALWALVEKHLPISIMDHVGSLQKAARDIDSHYQPRITVVGDQTTIAIEEKFLGAAEEKPLTFTAHFVGTEAVAEFQTIMQRYQETGEKTEIPESLVERVEFPDLFKKLFGPGDGQVKMSLVPPPLPRKLPVRISFLCDDGDEYVCHHIVLRGVQSGTKEATLLCDQADIPFHLKIVLRSEDLWAGDSKDIDCSINLWTRDGAYSATQWLEWLQVSTCLSKPVRMVVENLEHGFTFFEGRVNQLPFQPPDKGHVAFYRRLAEIQTRTCTPIFVPDRDIEQEEVLSAYELHQIVTTGRIEGTWSASKVMIQPSPALLDALIAGCSDEQPGVVYLEVEQAASLLGVEIPLGRVRTTLFGAKVKNREELQDRIAELRSGDASIELIFEPVGEGRSLQEYMKWMPPETRPPAMPLPSPVTADVRRAGDQHTWTPTSGGPGRTA